MVSLADYVHHFEVRGQSVALAMAGGLAFEVLFPGNRPSLASRMRGVFFWTLYVLTGAAAAHFTILALKMASITPLVSLDLRGTTDSNSWLVVILAFTVLPFSALFVFDFFYYWFHRLQHKVPLFWRLHSVHHSIEELNAASAYHHVFEEILRIPFIVLPMTLMVQVSPPYVPLQFAFLAILGQLIHADTKFGFGPLRYFVVEPRYHRIHHSLEAKHYDKNFAAFFPIYDVLFGTAYWPAKDEYPKTGLTNFQEPRSLKSWLLPKFTDERREVAETAPDLATRRHLTQ